MNTPKNPPRLLRSALTGQVYIVTRYRVTGEHEGRELITASTKYDVTEQFKRLMAEVLPEGEELDLARLRADLAAARAEVERTKTSLVRERMERHHFEGLASDREAEVERLRAALGETSPKEQSAP